MNDVKYFSPKSLDEAVGLLAEYGGKATVLAGGTDIVPKINYYDFAPEVLVYIGRIGLDYVKEEKGGIAIGACTPTAKLAVNDLLTGKAAALREAACKSGSCAVRTMATIGGNLANASPAADLATPLLAMEAEVKLTAAGGTRTVPLAEFFTGPGKTVLQPGELLTEIRIPALQGQTAFLKLGRRKAMTLSVVNVAVQLIPNGGTVKTARIAVGAMAPTPLRCTAAESMLTGKKMEAGAFEECAEKAISELSPIDDQRASAWYRRRAGKAVVARALGLAAGTSR